MYNSLHKMIAWVMASENGKLLVPTEKRKRQILKWFPECPENKIITPPKPKNTELVEGVNYFEDEITRYKPTPSTDKGD